MPLRDIPESGSGVGPLVWIGTEEEMSIGVALITSEARARLARGTDPCAIALGLATNKIDKFLPSAPDTIAPRLASQAGGRR